MEDPKPAKYTETSVPEARSRNILLELLNERHIRGEIRVLDKVPNVDGTLDFTDDEGYPIGKFEIQLKTVHAPLTGAIKYQCEIDFFGYCKKAQLPIFFIGVDHNLHQAFWLHMSSDVVSDALQRRRVDANSVTLNIPRENVINRDETLYLVKWHHIIEENRDKIHNYGASKKEREELERLIDELQLKLNPATDLPNNLLRDLYTFFDNYNMILDWQFPTVKRMLYLDFWKVGIAVISHDSNSIRYFLFPIRMTESQAPVKTISEDNFRKFENSELNFVLANFILEAVTDLARFQTQSLSYAYSLHEHWILDIIGKKSLPIEDDFIAHEYLVAFIDDHVEYLVLEQGASTYNLKDVEFKLRCILPILEGNKIGWAEDVREADVWSDRHVNYSKERWSKMYADALAAWKRGEPSKVKVTIVSDYNIDLIYHYISYLERQGESVARRQYKMGVQKLRSKDPRNWTDDERNDFKTNFTVCISNFVRVYGKCIVQNFPNIESDLIINYNESTTLVAILSFDESYFGYVTYLIRLKPLNTIGSRIFCYYRDDPRMPFGNSLRFEVDTVIKIEGDEYSITGHSRQEAKFIMHSSPSYELIRSILYERVKEFFSRKTL